MDHDHLSVRIASYNYSGSHWSLCYVCSWCITSVSLVYMVSLSPIPWSMWFEC